MQSCLKTTVSQNLLGLAAQTGRLLLPGSARDRIPLYYQTFFDLFSIVGEETGFLNLGYAADPSNADLATVQKALVRHTTRGLVPRGRWLDVGCGQGGPACLMAQDHPKLAVTGINITRPQIRKAAWRAGEQKLEGRVDFRFGDALDMPFKNSLFEGVYAIETAFHYPDKAAFGREAFRVLLPGGRLAVADIVWKASGHPKKSGPRSWFWRNFLASPELFTADQWTGSLASAGFEKIQVEDITAQTLGLFPLWLQQVEKHRDRLEALYSRAMIRVGLAFFSRVLPRLPFDYILVNAQKPQHKGPGQPPLGMTSH